jgi:hypothetical protein
MKHTNGSDGAITVLPLLTTVNEAFDLIRQDPSSGVR